MKRGFLLILVAVAFSMAACGSGIFFLQSSVDIHEEGGGGGGGGSTTQKIIVRFSNEIDVATVSANTLFIVIGEGTYAQICNLAQAISSDVGCDNTLLCSITPKIQIDPDSKLSICFSNAIKYKDGSVFGEMSSSLEPKGESQNIPEVMSVMPLDGAAGVKLDTNVTVQFNDNINTSTITSSTFSLRGGGRAISAERNYTSATKTAVLDPVRLLSAGTRYTATLTTGIKNIEGVSLANIYSWSFTTDEAPTVVETYPEDDSFDIPTNVIITARFNEPMDDNTIDGTSFTLQGAGPVAGVVTYNGVTDTASLTPNENLLEDTLYTATITTLAKNANGTPLAQNKTWVFRTVAPVRGWTSTSVSSSLSKRNSHASVWTGTEMIVWGGYDAEAFNSGAKYNPTTDSWTNISTVDVPQARYSHTAVWTGSQMIVWGGLDTWNNLLNSGGRYDPAVDSWSGMQVGPDARYRHSAVWTGDEMIVWGGNTGLAQTNTGGRYDPDSDTWVVTSIGNGAPSGRIDHTAVWTGSKMFVWGGISVDGRSNSGKGYDPVLNSWGSMSTNDAPTPRSNHTSVWTGSMMIVWGGMTDDGATNSGGRYNPAIDSWTSTNIIAAPDARSRHSAVWADSEMIVWGGDDSLWNFINTGGRYDPVSNSWLSMSLIDVPDARDSHTAVWTGTEMVVWGGWGNALGITNTGGRYDPDIDSWAPTSTGLNVPISRYNHTAVWTGTEMIVWGGTDSGWSYTNTGGRYDPFGDSWTATSLVDAPASRELHTAVWTTTEMIVWGGWAAAGLTNTGGRYYPATDVWAAVSLVGSPTSRTDHSAISTLTEMIVWGGMDESWQYVNSGGKYNPATNSWSATSTSDPNMVEARESHSAVWTGAKMIVWGGYTDAGAMSLNTGGIYDPATDIWTPTATGVGTPDERYNHSTVWTGTEMVVWGGTGGGGIMFNTGAKYDPATESWTGVQIDSSPSARHLHSAVWTGSKMVIWGGEDAFGDFLNSGGIYDPNSNSWDVGGTSLINAPHARYLHTAVWADDRMVIWGGRDGSDSFDSGGRYDLTTDEWSSTMSGGVPSARQLHSAIWTGTEMIVWGGKQGVVYLNSGGRYNPVTNSWNSVTTVGAPLSRSEHTAVWSGSEMIIWGGYRGAYLNSGGRYDPATDQWNSVQIAGAPLARSSHSAVWAGTEMIIWGGGRYDTFDIFNSGGRYDPESDSWSSTSLVDAPSPRAEHFAVWSGSEMIIWGGHWDNAGGAYEFYITGGRYDPGSDSWRDTTILRAPPIRWSGTVVWTGSEMIVWGGEEGYTGNVINSGGRYKPASDSWTPTSLLVEPRTSHTAIWTGSRMFVWSGYDEGMNYVNTGDSYDPVSDTWSAITTLNAPIGRANHSAVWSGSVMIVWGGGRGIGNEVNTGGRYRP